MKVVFFGVGEAFDKGLANTSLLVITERSKLLLDCGYSVPQPLWRYNSNPNFLDAIYISHQHYDHFGGIPPLLLRMWEGGRTKPLVIICTKGLKDCFHTFMELAYKGFMDKFGFKVQLVEADNNGMILCDEFVLAFGETEHSTENLAIRISDGKQTVVYGGDGALLKDDFLYQGLDLLVAEAYSYDGQTPGHSSVISAIDFGRHYKAGCIALVHLGRNFREDDLPKVADQIAVLGGWVPRPGDIWTPCI